MSEDSQLIEAADRVREKLYAALLARLDEKGQRMLGLYEELMIGRGLVSGEWRPGPRCVMNEVRRGLELGVVEGVGMVI